MATLRAKVKSNSSSSIFQGNKSLLIFTLTLPNWAEEPMSQWKDDKKVECSTLRAYQAQRSILRALCPNKIHQIEYSHHTFHLPCFSTKIPSILPTNNPPRFWPLLWIFLISHCHWGAKLRIGKSVDLTSYSFPYSHGRSHKQMMAHLLVVKIWPHDSSSGIYWKSTMFQALQVAHEITRVGTLHKMTSPFEAQNL